jgi:cobyrinic acid a,c-diamide synthase
MKESIKKAIEKGMPIMAECGGFMYLLDSIEDKEKNTYEVVGALKGKAFWTGKLVRFGYVSIVNNSGETIKGHEFHYYDTDNNGGELTVIKPSTGSSYKACHRLNGGYVGFPHLYYPSNMNYVKSFVEVMKNYGGK